MAEIKPNYYPTYTNQDVEILDKTTSFRGFFTINTYKIRHRLYNGQWSGAVTREMFERGHAAVVLPYKVDTDELVLVEQFRLGALSTKTSPWLLEAVAGMFGPDESAEDVARREADEEAGLTLGRVEPMLSYLSSPGGTTERIHLFVGEVVGDVVPGIYGLAEENEDIRVHLLPRADVMQLLSSGVIDNAATVIALQWLALHGDALRQRWLAGETGVV